MLFFRGDVVFHRAVLTAGVLALVVSFGACKKETATGPDVWATVKGKGAPRAILVLGPSPAVAIRRIDRAPVVVQRPGERSEDLTDRSMAQSGRRRRRQVPCDCDPRQCGSWI